MNPLRLAAIALLGFAVPASAGDPPKPWHEFKANEPIKLEPDKAYIFVRTVEMYGFRFVRIDGDNGAQVDRENLVDLKGFQSIDKSFPGQAHLLAVTPGTYWLYGVKTEYYLDGPWLNCLCMGTVRFTAKAGTITDLGTIRDIAYETRGGKRPDRRGKTHNLLGIRDDRAIQVEPVTDRDQIPPAIQNMPRTAATYSAAGWLPNIDGTRIDRISAMPGIIGYDRDRVVDTKTGKVYP